METVRRDILNQWINETEPEVRDQCWLSYQLVEHLEELIYAGADRAGQRNADS